MNDITAKTTKKKKTSPPKKTVKKALPKKTTAPQKVATPKKAAVAKGPIVRQMSSADGAKQAKETEIKEMHRLFEKQKAAFKKYPFPTAAERIDQLTRLRDAIPKHMNALSEAGNKDFGNRSITDMAITEILPALDSLNHTIKHVKSWMKDQKRPISPSGMPGKAKIIYQPLGVVGIITTWNYTLKPPLSALMGALAAGNRVIMKLSGMVPHAAVAFKNMISEVFDEDKVAVILPGAGGLGSEFAKIPFDILHFTGSEHVGKQIMAAAAQNLTPVVLELGGKSPAIISKDVPMRDAAKRIAFGKCINAGQTCITCDYVLVPETRLDECVSELIRSVSKMYPSIRNNGDFTSVISEKHVRRIQSYIDDAEKKGAKVIQINPANETFEPLKDRKMPIHLVVDATDDLLVMQEEIFGPILPIVTYKTLDDAIAYVNERPRPLSFYVFDYFDSTIDYVLRNTYAGGVTTNDIFTHYAIEELPFGGIGASGMGKYHGHAGFLTFSSQKSVLYRGRINPVQMMMYPPWGKIGHKMIMKYVLKSDHKYS